MHKTINVWHSSANLDSGIIPENIRILPQICTCPDTEFISISTGQIASSGSKICLGEEWGMTKLWQDRALVTNRCAAEVS